MTVPLRTRHEQAYERLREDILGGRLQPGQKLRFAELGATYDASVGSLREALSRLVEQGLVRSEPRRGFRVTPITETGLKNLTAARREIEVAVLRHAIEEGDLTWESELLAAHHRLASTPMLTAEDPPVMSDEWAQAHADFHEALLAGCANPLLVGIAHDLRAPAELYQRLSVPLGQGRERNVGAEHREIMAAALARDAARACELLDTHISRTTDILLASGLVADD
ncbi:GntR family transcriptional regulator [Sinomonas sp. G460-2]|uniref:GntR family transcriptional regulator n=1 Tax=Sinomonas sp. G460-2 TaxID=3393464 RepID=UPI0039EDF3CB